MTRGEQLIKFRCEDRGYLFANLAEFGIGAVLFADAYRYFVGEKEKPEEEVDDQRVLTEDERLEEQIRRDYDRAMKGEERSSLWYKLGRGIELAGGLSLMIYSVIDGINGVYAMTGRSRADAPGDA